MKKHRFLSLLLLVVFALPLGGCALYGNDRSTVSLMTVEEREDGLAFVLTEDTTLLYDSAEGKLSLLEEGAKPSEPILDGSTIGNHLLIAAEGFETLRESVIEYAQDVYAQEDGYEPLVTALAYKENGAVYGFCNVYRSATGFLSGGGQIDAKKIVRGMTFSYCMETEELTVSEEFDKCVVVAYDGTCAMYFKNREYFVTGTSGETVKICEDIAYDTGLTHYSRAMFWFGGGYCVIYFHKEGEWSLQESYLLTTMAGEVLAEYNFSESTIKDKLP